MMRNKYAHALSAVVLALALTLLAGQDVAARQTDFYVSPTGDDASPGTHARPDSEDVVFWSYFENENIAFRNNVFVCVRRVPSTTSGSSTAGHSRASRTSGTRARTR